MSWSLTRELTTITLPSAPRKITEKNPSAVKEYPMPGTLPLLIAFGKKGRLVALQGLLREAGKTSAQLETDYLAPLRSWVGKLVALSAPDTRYDGDYILSSFNYEEIGGLVNAFRYVIELTQGSEVTEL